MKGFYDVEGYVEIYSETNTQFAKNRKDEISAYIKKNNLTINSALDLASGTGVFLDLLQKEFSIKNCIGLDFSKKMIGYSKAHVKNKNVAFKYGDMTNFNFNQKFDIITCNYDAINHLGSFEDWVKVFNNAYKHLNEGGCFIFDYNTLLKLKTFNRCSYKENDNYDLIGEISNANNQFNFKQTFYIKRADGFYEKRQTSLTETTYKNKEIFIALKNAGLSKVKFCDNNFNKCNPEKVKRAFVLCVK